MAFGFGVLRLSSQTFWNLTPRELASAMKRTARSGGGALSRAGLEGLMVRFPDQSEKEFLT